MSGSRLLKLNASHNEEEEDGDVGDPEVACEMEEDDPFLNSLLEPSGELVMEEESTGNSLLDLDRGNVFNRTAMAKDLSLVSRSNNSDCKHLEGEENGTYGRFRDPDFFDTAPHIDPSAEPSLTPSRLKLPVNLFEGFDGDQSAGNGSGTSRLSQIIHSGREHTSLSEPSPLALAGTPASSSLTSDYTGEPGHVSQTSTSISIVPPSLIVDHPRKNISLPITRTNNSNHDRKIVILIEPLADHRQVESFFGNYIKMSRSIYNSIFEKFNIIQISKNFFKKLVIVELSLRHYELQEVDVLLKVNRLGDWSVRCRRPHSKTMTYGVVGPIGCDTSDKEIADSLTTQGYNNVEVKRITKSRGGETTKTVYVRIGLSIPMLPEFVYLEYQRFKMKPYISKSWQCYRCQKFGHNADNCRSNIRCVACAGPHAVADCTVREKSHVKCINCGGNHTASYGGCQFIKNARVVEQVRSEKKLSYRDAVTLVKSSADGGRQPQSNHTKAVLS